MFVQKYRRELELRLNAKECEEAFERLKSEHSIFNLYPTVESLRNLFDRRNKNYAQKDEVMAILLTEFQRSNVIYALINISFWNNLYWIYLQRQSKVSDQRELFNRIQEAFFYSISSYNLERLPKKIDVNILLNTKKKVIAWEKENLHYKEKNEQLEDFYKDGLSPLTLWKSNIYPEQMEEYLLDMVYRKVITETQYNIILETQVYKKMNQREWAEKAKISHAAARILMLRAKVAMSCYEEKRKKEKENQNFFVTKRGFSGAYIYRGANMKEG